MTEAFKNAEYAIDKMFIEERIDGKLYLMAKPTREHGRVQSNVSKIFNNYFKKRKKRCEALTEMEVTINERNYFSPDVAVYCYKRSEDLPTLIVEIVSKSTKNKDYTAKMKKYAELGIPEYWIITYETRSVDIYLLEDGRYEFKVSYAKYLPEDFPKIKCIREDEEKEIIYEFSPFSFPELVIKVEDVFYSPLDLPEEEDDEDED